MAGYEFPPLRALFGTEAAKFIEVVETLDASEIKKAARARGSWKVDDGSSEYPFAVVTAAGSRELTDLFLKHGASGRARNEAGQPMFPIRAAVENGHIDLAYYIASSCEISMNDVLQCIFDELPYRDALKEHVESMPFRVFSEFASQFKNQHTQDSELTRLYLDQLQQTKLRDFFQKPENYRDLRVTVQVFDAAEDEEHASASVVDSSGTEFFKHARVLYQEGDDVYIHLNGGAALKFNSDTGRLSRLSVGKLKKAVENR